MMLRRIHPLAKIVLALVWVSAAMLLKSLPGLGVLGLGAFLFLLLAGCWRHPWLLLSLGAGLVMLAGVHLLIGGTAAEAGLTVLRLFVIVGVSISFTLTTDPADLLRGLRLLPLPGSLLLGLSILWRCLPMLKNELCAIHLACRLEGVPLRPWRPLLLFRYALTPLSFSMVGFADDLSLSLLSRGICLDSVAARQVALPLRPGDAVFCCCGLLTAVLAWSVRG